MKGAKFEGHPCVGCNAKTRYVSDKKCVACKSIRSAAWRKLNVESLRVYRQASYAKDKDHCKAMNTKWRKNNPEKYRASNAKWCERNRERVREISAQWSRENRQRRCYQAKNYNAAKKTAFKDGTATVAFLESLDQAKECFYCAAVLQKGQVCADHRIPLRAYGAPHTAWNLVPSCQLCNRRKHDIVDLATVQAVIATPGGQKWAEGPGREWLAHVLPKIQDGSRIARDLFAERLVAA